MLGGSSNTIRAGSCYYHPHFTDVETQRATALEAPLLTMTPDSYIYQLMA